MVLRLLLSFNVIFPLQAVFGSVVFCPLTSELMLPALTVGWGGSNTQLAVSARLVVRLPLGSVMLKM